MKTPRDEAGRLIQELLEGTISPEDFSRLEELLLSDASLRKDYFALMATDQMLVDSYEMPGHLALEAGTSTEAFRHPGLIERRSRVRWFAGIGAAAALLIAGVVAWQHYDTPPPHAIVSGSADSYFLIDGTVVNEATWTPGSRLDVRDGVVVARLNGSTEACIDGPAQLILAENGRDIELRRGKVFFTVGKEDPSLRVFVSGAVVKEKNTSYGIRASEGGSCEVHVVSGEVKVDRGKSAGHWNVAAGEAASWLNRGTTRLDSLDVAEFRKALPDETTVFEDDFSDPKMTRLSGKMPDVGQSWTVEMERAPTNVGGGKLDTSGGSRRLRATFLQEPYPDNHQVVLMSFTTRQPSWIWDKQTRLGGIEKIALVATDGRVICSVQARAKEGHRWRLRDEATGLESELTGISVFQESDLTLRYDALGGKITLHSGTSTQAQIIAEVPASIRAVPGSIVILNDDGGDLALSRISVRTVNYPGTSTQ